MSLLLNIDTATSSAGICLAENGLSLAMVNNEDQKQHASFVQPAIKELLNKTGKKINDLDAVAVTIGPGSYTGLRVGLASAKGICYALNIPLITVSTLKVMASAAINTRADLLCPMIDARRMEVFAAIYNRSLDIVVPEQAIMLTESSFVELMEEKSILFFGDGAPKWKTLVHNNNAIFDNCHFSAVHLAALSFGLFKEKKFSDLAYTEPVYLKEFYSTFKNT
jgi:tRNA threonylcarbamoyladenosine biosynthesis protein TsaB